MFSCEFCKHFQNIFYRAPRQLLLILHCNSLIRNNPSDFSTIQYLAFFGNFVDKCLQLNLLFTLRLQFIFEYLKSQNKRVLLQNFELNHIGTSCIFLLRHYRTVITNLFKNTLLQLKFVHI